MKIRSQQVKKTKQKMLLFVSQTPAGRLGYHTSSKCSLHHSAGCWPDTNERVLVLVRVAASSKCSLCIRSCRRRRRASFSSCARPSSPSPRLTTVHESAVVLSTPHERPGCSCFLRVRVHEIARALSAEMVGCGCRAGTRGRVDPRITPSFGGQRPLIND